MTTIRLTPTHKSAKRWLPRPSTGLPPARTGHKAPSSSPGTIPKAALCQCIKLGRHLDDARLAKARQLSRPLDRVFLEVRGGDNLRPCCLRHVSPSPVVVHN